MHLLSFHRRIVSAGLLLMVIDWIFENCYSNIFGDLFSFGCPIIYAFSVYVYMRTALNAPLYPRRRKIVLYFMIFDVPVVLLSLIMLGYRLLLAV